MKNRLLLLALVFLGPLAYADLSGGGLTDYFGNGVTSQSYSGTRNSLDVETVVGGTVIDPRTRTWTLLNSTDSVNAVQSGSWTAGRTWTLLNTTDSVNAVQSGTWTFGRTWTLSSGTDSVAAVQSGTWTVAQGSPNSVPSAWPVKVTDGTNVMGIAPGSTAPTVSQPAGVVSLSPNSSLPVGTNSLGTVGLNSGANTVGFVNQGATAASVANSWAVKITDGTNTNTVKAGSSQSALTDNAIVITGRPDNVGTPTQTGVSCAATSTTLLAASTATMFLSIRNPTTSVVTIWINTAGAAAVVAAPSLDLPPGAEAFFAAEGASFLPTSQINCISSGAASSVTITYK